MNNEQTIEIVAPIIHMNGTSSDALLDALGEFYSVINDAVNSLRDIAPNGRDYYPQPGLMEKAVAQHQRRSKVLTDLMDEIERQMEAISDQ